MIDNRITDSIDDRFHSSSPKREGKEDTELGEKFQQGWGTCRSVARIWNGTERDSWSTERDTQVFHISWGVQNLSDGQTDSQSAVVHKGNSGIRGLKLYR
jgi:hypothetical protein